MYDFMLTSEERELKKEVRRFVSEKVTADFRRAMDRDEITYPREGMEQSYISYCSPFFLDTFQNLCSAFTKPFPQKRAFIKFLSTQINLGGLKDLRGPLKKWPSRQASRQQGYDTADRVRKEGSGVS
jgi:hypothetical protein